MTSNNESQNSIHISNSLIKRLQKNIEFPKHKQLVNGLHFQANSDRVSLRITVNNMVLTNMKSVNIFGPTIFLNFSSKSFTLSLNSEVFRLHLVSFYLSSILFYLHTPLYSQFCF